MYSTTNSANFFEKFYFPPNTKICSYQKVEYFSCFVFHSWFIFYKFCSNPSIFKPFQFFSFAFLCLNILYSVFLVSYKTVIIKEKNLRNIQCSFNPSLFINYAIIKFKRQGMWQTILLFYYRQYYLTRKI